MLERLKALQVPLKARKQTLLDLDWRFLLGDPQGAEQPNYDDSAWRQLCLPHDWSIEGEFDRNAPTGGAGAYLPMGIGWYRKVLNLTEETVSNHVMIEFGGVMLDSLVYVNGHCVGNRPYGYSSFCYDITPYVHAGENTIAVRVNASHQPGSRWYPGAGIYRHVYLIETGHAHVNYSGITVTTPEISAEAARVDIVTEVVSHFDTTRSLVAKAQVLAPDGTVVAAVESPLRVDYEEISTVKQSVCVRDPLLWNLETPHMYRVHVTIVEGVTVLDDAGTTFGIRTFGYDIKEGFTINGDKVKIQGLCMHQNMGCMGIAVPERMLESNLLKLKRAGCNGIRLTHYPHPKEMLDLLDTIGFVAIGEAFDEWEICRPKTADVGSDGEDGECSYGYAEYFKEWWEKDLVDFIRRDKNHPCVAFWSIGNEIFEQRTLYGGAMARELVAVCHREDPTRPVTSACMDTSGLGTEVCHDSYMEALDIIGVNYVDHWGPHKETYYFALHEKFPEKILMGTEHVSSGGIRGDYDLYKHPCRWYTMYYNKMIDVEMRHKFLSMHPYVLGDFMWTGLEYLGEAAWPYISPCTGMLDFCGFPKDGYYLLHSIWQKKENVLYLVPHWNYEGHEGEAIPVICYTNCDYVELFVNGQSYGRQSWQFPRPGMYDNFFEFREPVLEITTSDLHLMWQVPYAPGEIKAVGYKNGEVVLEQVVRTAGKPAKLELSVNTDAIAADRQDVAQIAVRVLDDKGTLVPDATIPVTFTVEGAAELLGVDNGDIFINSGYRGQTKEAFNGMLAAMIRSNGKTGQITVRAKSELGEETICLSAN